MAFFLAPLVWECVLRGVVAAVLRIRHPLPRRRLIALRNDGVVWIFWLLVVAVMLLLAGWALRHLGGDQGAYKDQGFCEILPNWIAEQTAWPMYLHVAAFYSVGLTAVVIGLFA